MNQDMLDVVLYYIAGSSHNKEEAEKIVRLLRQIDYSSSEVLMKKSYTLVEQIHMSEVRGKAEGIRQGKCDVATNLLREGATGDMVARVTELSLEDIQRLKEMV